MKLKNTKTHKPRNPLHDHPLMKKGGVHQKSHKAVRRALKQGIKTMEYDVMVIP